MKILHVIPSVGSVRGGPSQSIVKIVTALCQQEITAEIIATNDNGPNLLNVPLNQFTVYQQAPIWFFPRFSPPIKPIREYAFSSKFTTWLWQHINDYDLVHLHALFSYTCTATMAIARLKKVPYIVRPNGLLCKWSLQQSALKKRNYLRLIERSNLNHSAALEFTSLQEQQEVSILGLQPNSFILPYGLSLPAIIPNARQKLRQILQVPEDEPVILFISRLHYKKGLDYLIPALGKLSDRRFTFILAGNGDPDYEAKVEGMLKTAGIDERTYRPGFVEGEMKDLLLQGSDIFALTSHSESFGLAVLEAIAAGLSIVTTPGVPLAPEVEQHQLGYITQMNVPEIASVLENSLNSLADIKQTQKRQERSRQLITDKYTWSSIASNLIEIYKVILQQKKL